MIGEAVVGHGNRRKGAQHGVQRIGIFFQRCPVFLNRNVFRHVLNDPAPDRTLDRLPVALMGQAPVVQLGGWICLHKQASAFG